MELIVQNTPGRGTQVVFWTIDTSADIEITESQVTTSIVVT